MAQVFSCEFCEISKNTFFTEHLWATAFDNLNDRQFQSKVQIQGDPLTILDEQTSIGGGSFFKAFPKYSYWAALTINSTMDAFVLFTFYLFIYFI